ncbi:MAG: hypothetical protein ACRDBP_06515 [Luteolibacter sp.]
MFKPTLRTLVSILLLGSVAFGQSFKLPEGASVAERKRFERFEAFQIKGVCGDSDLERLAGMGVNTVRGYTLGEPAAMRKKLDAAHRLGMKMILSEWMPHHGDNKNHQGDVWSFDYQAKGDKMVESLIRRVEGIGDHPAILMWGLGNEVHLDEPYLRVVNRMSQAIHERFPHHVTSLTMINAKPDAIAAVKKFAPDLDVLGIQSYSRGAVRGAIRKTEELWGKPFYMSEFNTNGPWNFAKTEWGVEYDEPVTQKVTDLKDCYTAIDASPLCLGSTIFVWGPYSAGDRPTYFSLLLDPSPQKGRKIESFDDLLTTPQADVMEEHFTGKPAQGNRAPVLSKLEFASGGRSRLAKPGEPLSIRFAAEDADRDQVKFTTWILEAKARRVKVLEGPFSQKSSGEAVIKSPKAPGEYLLLVYAKDDRGGASASTLPFKVAGDSPTKP